jgi:hypothetical protein
MNLATALQLDKVSRFESEFNGEKFWFDAKEEMLTPAFLDNLKNWDSDPLACAEALAGCITAWDIDMNGKKFPPTAANLAQIPKKFLNHLLTVIVESWQGDPQKPSE